MILPQVRDFAMFCTVHWCVLTFFTTHNMLALFFSSNTINAVLLVHSANVLNYVVWCFKQCQKKC